MAERNGNSRSPFHGLWALTNRELKKWYKNPYLLLMSIIQPLIWMGLFGRAMNIGAIISSNKITIPPINPALTDSQLFQLGQALVGPFDYNNEEHFRNSRLLLLHVGRYNFLRDIIHDNVQRYVYSLG